MTDLAHIESIVFGIPCGYELGKPPATRAQAQKGGAVILQTLCLHYETADPEVALRHALRDLMHGAALLGADPDHETAYALSDYREDVRRIDRAERAAG